MDLGGRPEPASEPQESSIAHMCTSCFSKCIPTTNSVDGRDLAAPLLDADDTADEMTWWVSGSSFIPAGNTDIKCDPVVINMAYFKVNTEHDNSHLPQGQLIHAQAVERYLLVAYKQPNYLGSDLGWARFKLPDKVAADLKAQELENGAKKSTPNSFASTLAATQQLPRHDNFPASEHSVAFHFEDLSRTILRCSNVLSPPLYTHPMLLTSQHTVAWSSSANMLQVTVESNDFAGRIVGVGKGLPYNVNQDASNKFYIIFEAEDEHFDETVEMLIFSEDDAVGTRIVKAMNKILMDAAARGSLD